MVFVSEAEMQAEMGGPPPADPAQRDAYFKLALKRLTAKHGPDWERSAFLLAGLAPESMWRHFCGR